MNRWKNSKPFQILCMILAVIFTWATTRMPVFADSEGITLDNLIRQYPQARFESVSMDEFRVVAANLENGQVIIHPAKAEALPCDPVNLEQLAETWPHILFRPMNFKEFSPSKKWFRTRVLYILKNYASPPEGLSSGVTVEQLMKMPPAERGPICLVRDMDAYLKYGSYFQDGIVFAAVIGQSSDKEMRNAHRSPPGSTEHEPPPDTSCLVDIPDLGGSWGDGDAAVIVFVLVGVFVVAALVVYAGKYIYDASAGKTPLGHWWEISPHVSFFEKERNNDFKDNGVMSGIKLSTGMIDPRMEVGLTGEIGWINIKTISVSNNRDDIDVGGLYGMVGPTIRFLMDDGALNPNATYVMLEMIAGVTEHHRAKMISAARAELNFGLSDHMRLGFNIGSLYFDMDETDGVIGEENNFRLTAGINIGYRF